MSIGEVLAGARDQAGLSIAQVSEQTRIRQGIIQGIEADDYAVCGGDFYVRGHIRSIAQAVGTDPAPLIEEYDQDFSDTGPISATGIEELVARSRPPQRPRLNPAVLIAAAVVVVLGIGGYLLATGLGRGRGPAPAAAPNSLAGHGSGSASPAAAPASRAVVVRLTSPHGTSVVFTTLSGRYLSRSYAAAGTAVTYTLHRAVHIKLSDPAGVRLTVDGKNPLPGPPCPGPGHAEPRPRPPGHRGQPGRGGPGPVAHVVGAEPAAGERDRVRRLRPPRGQPAERATGHRRQAPHRVAHRLVHHPPVRQPVPRHRPAARHGPPGHRGQGPGQAGPDARRALPDPGRLGS